MLFKKIKVFFLYRKIKCICNFVRRNLKNNIVIENVLNSGGTFMHKEGRPSIYMFKLFLKLFRKPDENSSYFAIFQMFNYV